jgi:hypothetical protein
LDKFVSESFDPIVDGRTQIQVRTLMPNQLLQNSFPMTLIVSLVYMRRSPRHVENAVIDAAQETRSIQSYFIEPRNLQGFHSVVGTGRNELRISAVHHSIGIQSMNRQKV